MIHFPEGFRQVGNGILNLQKARYSAGYSLASVVELDQAKGFVDIAIQCVEIIENARRKDRLAFASWIVFDRKGGVADALTRARAKDPTAFIAK